MYRITASEILHLIILSMGLGGCAFGLGLAAPSGHPPLAVAAVAATAGLLSTLLTLTYRVMVQRGGLVPARGEFEEDWVDE